MQKGAANFVKQIILEMTKVVMSGLEMTLFCSGLPIR